MKKRQFKRSISFILSVLIIAVFTASAVSFDAENKAGDVNKDGAVNNKDVTALFRVCSGGEADVDPIACDCNGDGATNNKDIVLLFKFVSGGDVVIYYGQQQPDEPVAVSSVALSAQTKTVRAGDKMVINSKVLPENASDKSLSWSVTSGASNAAVDENGRVTGVKAGKCTVTAKSADGTKSASVEITVTAASSDKGSGTAADPYVIKTAADLKNVANYLNKSGVYFVQAADIDLKDVDFTSLGTDDKPFKGSYDGRGYVIKNLKTGTEKCSGLFGVTINADLYNINIEGLCADENGGSMTGGLCSQALCTVINGCTVKGELKTSGGNAGLLSGRVASTFKDRELIVGCTVEGKITGSGSNVGGLIGCVDVDNDRLGEEYDSENLGTVITGCRADVEINGPGSDVGGLIGYMAYGVVKYCSASGDITAGVGKIRGGLIGEAYENNEICFCCASGNITTAGTGYGDAFCGGLIGFMLSRNTVHDCYATGDIECAGTYSDCQDNTTYNGGLWFRYRNPCGALIGCMYCVSAYEPIYVYNCYATGTVNVLNPCEDELIYCKGSLIGLLHDTASVKLIKSEYRKKSSPDIDTSLKIDITEDMMNGNMIGKLECNYCVGTLKETYTPANVIVRNERKTAYVGQYTSLPSYRVVTNITEGDLSSKATFTGFDFKNVWTIASNGPVLRGL